jgi:hypothetical protein
VPNFPTSSAPHQQPHHQFGGDHAFLQAPAVVSAKPSLAETVRVRRPSLGNAPPIWLVALAVLALTGVIVVLVLMLLQGRGNAQIDPPTLNPAELSMASLQHAGTPAGKALKAGKAEPKPVEINVDVNVDAEPRAPAEDGYLTVQCVPGCTAVSAESHALGPSPVVRAPLPPGTYRLMLKGNNKTKVVEVSVASGESSPVRVSME